MNLIFESFVRRNWQEITAEFNQKLFQELKPPGVTLTVLRFDGCKTGDEVHVRLKTFGMKQNWVSHITQDNQSEREWSFVDEGHKIPWPLKSWRHHHRVISLDEHTSKIIDDINFECAHPWMNPLMYPVLWMSFSIRPGRYKKFFEDRS